mgnify:CR=1 FL=1
MEEFVTVSEVSEMAGVRPATVRRWISRGILPAMKVGRVWLILRMDAESIAMSLRVSRENER